MKQTHIDRLLEHQIIIFGDLNDKNDCWSESVEQVTFFNWLLKQQNTHSLVALHVRNEGKRTFNQTRQQKIEGMNVGASDIIIPGSPTFVCELKRKNHRKSTISDAQIDYLIAAKNLGSFACVALGAEAAIAAFNYYIKKKVTK